MVRMGTVVPGAGADIPLGDLLVSQAGNLKGLFNTIWKRLEQNGDYGFRQTHRV